MLPREERRGMPDKDDFSLAKKLLGGIGKKKDEPAAAKKGASSEETGGDILSKLVGALKTASTPLSVVEPEGYVLLDRIREGEAIAPNERGPLLEPLQVALRK